MLSAWFPCAKPRKCTRARTDTIFPFDSIRSISITKFHILDFISTWTAQRKITWKVAVQFRSELQMRGFSIDLCIRIKSLFVKPSTFVVYEANWVILKDSFSTFRNFITSVKIHRNRQKFFSFITQKKIYKWNYMMFKVHNSITFLLQI